MATGRRKKAEVVPAGVGQRMRLWRTRAGLSLEAVGERIGVGRGHLSDVENGHGNLSFPRFLAYCKAVGASPSTVLEGLQLDE